MNIFCINIIFYWKRAHFRGKGVREIKKDNELYKLDYSGSNSRIQRRGTNKNGDYDSDFLMPVNDICWNGIYW